MKKTLFLLSALVVGTLSLGAAPVSIEEAENEPVGRDSLFVQWYRAAGTEAYDRYVQDFIVLEADSLAEVAVDLIPDSVYRERLGMIPSVIPLPYNEIVRRYILAYTGRLKGQMEKMLGLSRCYFPIIEEELDRQGMPQELKVLAMVESALQPDAVSRAGAAGIWQFMLRTGKGMGLEINSFVDERKDPAASTRAACRYLKQLYEIYGDWTLAIAAYNCGPGNINKALRRVPDAKSYWDIYDLLPRETRGYIPSFIAATYAYTFHGAHGMVAQEPPLPVATDTVAVNKMLHFEQVASTVGVPVETLRKLNPQYKLDIVPAVSKSYSLVLPVPAALDYAAREPEIHAKDTVYLTKYVDPDNYDPNRAPATAAASAPARSTYKVKSGEVLGTIARRHGVSVGALMRANNISDARKLRAGQVLRIP